MADNYASHKAPPVKTWLARHPRYHVHFTPASASWLNRVERWFALLAEKQIKLGVHANASNFGDGNRGIGTVPGLVPLTYLIDDSLKVDPTPVSRFPAPPHGSRQSFGPNRVCLTIPAS